MKKHIRTIGTFLIITLAMGLSACDGTHEVDLLNAIDLRDKGDYENAFTAIKTLAKKGNAKAQFNLGLMYRNGRGIEQDYKEADKWFLQAKDTLYTAANDGDAYAQYALGEMYNYGLGVSKDANIATRWYKKSSVSFMQEAEQGSAFAQYKMGVLNHDGKGVEKNDALAIRWYTLAAQQGHANAQYNVGYMYRNNQGIAESDKAVIDKQVMKWYRLASEQGHRNAQFHLALMYSTGEAGVEDNVYAYMWYDIAAPVHITAQRNRSIIEAILSSEELVFAKSLAYECKAKDYKDC